MTDASHKTIGRIVKVNHAGEYGAIRIYSAQILIAKLWFKDLLPFLYRTLEDEIKHCNIFAAAMPSRRTRPCYTMWLWSWGGYFLGLASALSGRNGIMLCTEAVEEAVHHHMNAQIEYFNGKDEELKYLIENIKIEELEHLHYAQAHVRHGMLTKTAYVLIYQITELLIWLSTQGALSRMKSDIQA